jgi:hypothetical protein
MGDPLRFSGNKQTRRESMSSTFSRHAMIKNNTTKVVTIVNIPDSFSSTTYFFIKIGSAYCVAGMYYNADDGLFYDDAEFTAINGVAVNDEQSS